jgi:N-acylneuraminate cytidylyltransferase
VNIAVIPARGGSKRIPKKNIKLFGGRPILAYSIEAAKACGLFEKIIVSTDSDEIAEIASQFGAESPFTRPPVLSDDFTGTNAVTKHAIEWLNERGASIAHACCIYATAPFLQARFLRQGFDLLQTSGRSFAFSVTSYDAPIQRALRRLPDGTIDPFQPKCMMSRSQDLEDAYHDAGQFYWGTAEAFLRNVSLFSTASVGVVVPRYLTKDIDTIEDWRQAELMYEALKRLSGSWDIDPAGTP